MPGKLPAIPNGKFAWDGWLLAMGGTGTAGVVVDGGWLGEAARTGVVDGSVEWAESTAAVPVTVS